MSAVWVVTEREFCDTEVIGVAVSLEAAQRVSDGYAGGPLAWVRVTDRLWAGARLRGGSVFYAALFDVDL